MTSLHAIHKILPVLAATLLAPMAARATVGWDPSNWIPSNVGGDKWTLSTSPAGTANATATSPNSGSTYGGSGGDITGALGNTPIPNGQKTYFEVTVDAVTGTNCNNGPYYYLQSAFGVGIGTRST